MTTAFTDFKWLFLSFEGRISRKDYWIGTGLMVLASFTLGVLGAILAFVFEPLAIVASLLSLAMIYPGLALCAKRWHDRGKSGWWTLVNLVPFVGSLYAIWELGIMPAADQENGYGVNPLAPVAA
jgi:uncharacterized membrane protein YhaH (DUF805 family)